MKSLSKSVKREFLYHLKLPKNIYLPLSVFAILFAIFIVLELEELFIFANVLIATTLTILIVSESAFQDDYRTGILEKRVSESNDLLSYIISKHLAQIFLIFLPMCLLSMLFTAEMSWPYFFAYMIMAMTLNNFFQLGSAISLKKNNALNALIMLPLLIPYIILIKDVFEMYSLANFYFLLAYFIFSDVFCNYLTIKILRIQVK